MNHFQEINQMLCGKSVFGDEWTVGAFISQSLMSACFELNSPGIGTARRRLLVIDLSGSADSAAAAVYRAANGLSGILPYSRQKIISCGTAQLLLLDTPLPESTADLKLNSYAAAKLGFDITAAIASLQNAGIVHRNIKPRNIVLCGESWMLDGLEMADYMRNTVNGQNGIGTRMYMPPESMYGRYDHTTDPYTLAAVLYTMLNNNRPPLMGRYEPLTDQAVEAAITRRMNGESIPPLSYVDTALDNIIRRALSPNPAQRYSHASEINAEFGRYLLSASSQSTIDNERAAAIADGVMNDASFASQWQLGSCLGTGTSGTVYRALSVMDGQEYALKVVRIPADESELKRMIASGMTQRELAERCSQAIAKASSEALMYMQLTDCSHILRMYDYGRVKVYNSSAVEFFWMQTELLSPIPDSIPDERAVAMIGLDVCTALSEIHAKGMTHRDVKPENILWAGNDGYKLSDFGVARMLRETAEATVIGSRSYMAPEILSGLVAKKSKKAYSNTVDIFSLGMTMYTLLNNNREPFLPPEPQPVTEADRILAEQRRLNGEDLPLPAHCSSRLGAIIAKACANNPAKRFRTADNMREALLNYLEL